MQTRTKMLIATLAVALPAFMLLNPHGPPGDLLWPEVEDDATGVQVPLMIAYGAANALAFGFAVAYLLFGYRWTARVLPVLSGPAHVAIAFVMGNFWLHDNLHAVNGANMAGIVWLTYLFHVPIILSGVVLAVAAMRSASARSPAPRPTAAHA